MNKFREYYHADKLISFFNKNIEHLSINNEPIINKICEEIINMDYYKKLLLNLNTDIDYDESTNKTIHINLMVIN